jgi:hypothetical protein
MTHLTCSDEAYPVVQERKLAILTHVRWQIKLHDTVFNEVATQLANQAASITDPSSREPA